MNRRSRRLLLAALLVLLAALAVWLRRTPAGPVPHSGSAPRAAGWRGALFGDRRYDRVFTYDNVAASYFEARGFRASAML